MLELDTPHGVARVHLYPVDSPRAALVLGHGAGGGVESADLVGATKAAREAVLCLAFPVHPPGRPEKTRLAELDAVTVPTLVVQGERDPFGIPPEGPNRKVVRIPGTHSLRSSAAVEAAVADW